MHTYANKEDTGGDRRMALIPDTHVVRSSGRDYFAHRTASGQIGIGMAFVRPDYHRRHVVMPDEESARRWLCENGLGKRQAKRLLAALYSEPS